ncbi:hypothetical protein ACH4LS_22680 [Streptomyces luteogriseus]|uniref:hypothetical protein n=1 Tax=Streptomyces luteogriseus TaxID=68233 RepID=UPI0037B503A6
MNDRTEPAASLSLGRSAGSRALPLSSPGHIADRPSAGCDVEIVPDLPGGRAVLLLQEQSGPALWLIAGAHLSDQARRVRGRMASLVSGGHLSEQARRELRAVVSHVLGHGLAGRKEQQR